MIGSMQDTIYTLGPSIIFVSLLLSIFTPLIHNLHEINVKLVAYSECANKMIDYAFLGKVYNFTECYLEHIRKPMHAECTVNNNIIICTYKNKTYAYPIVDSLSNTLE